ncbi:MAG TPA: S-methyl-5-thioribose-1-phosphate isomerase [Candidatus Binatia bacterium]|nr:S-methyl-5-thioribose-1-phosphate isomerase [Candidatus Binatia bacterium]
MTDDTPRPPDPGPSPAAADGTASGEAAGGEAGADLARRRFFRQFADDLVHGAATVVGVAGALQRSSAEAASVILGGSGAAGQPGGLTALLGAQLAGDPPPAPGDQANPAPGAPAGFRTAYRWDGDRLYLVDQRQLPGVLTEISCETGAEVAWALKEMVIRGAPAMGQAAAIGLALTAARMADAGAFARKATIKGTANALTNARPTAVNVRWAVQRVLDRFEEVGELTDDGALVASVFREEAEAIVTEAAADHERLATFGLAELPATPDRPLELLTHCNTGPLACGQFGTALGVVQAAVHAGREVHVFVDETRPYLQGARLTAWELAQAGVPHTVITDSAAGFILSTRKIDAVLVGADRVAANGDFANKIGTYPLAVLARRHGVPFYACAPMSSVDLGTPDGSAIQIELRTGEEITSIRGVAITPPDTDVVNPAFDVTPAELITAIVTDVGVLRPPFGPALAEAVATVAARNPAARPAPSSQPTVTVEPAAGATTVAGSVTINPPLRHARPDEVA